VGANSAAKGSSFSKGHIGLNFAEIPHIALLNIKPSHAYPCFKHIRIEIAPPSDSPYRKAGNLGLLALTESKNLMQSLTTY